MEKYKRIIICKLVFMLILTTFLNGCTGKPKPADGSESGKQETSDLVVSNETEGPSWSDVDGLVKVWKKDKEYYIYYDLEKWEEIHEISNYIKEGFPDSSPADRELLLLGLHEEIKDVAIVSIDGYGGSYDDRNNFPLVFMLMESGGVNWLYGNPPRDGALYEGSNEKYIEEEQYSFGYLPYLGDIESFSFESDGEGIGTMTLFAQTKDGLRYDMRHVLDFRSLTLTQWFSDYKEGFDSINLNLMDDGSATMYKVKSKDKIRIRYEGTYELHLDDSSSKGIRAPAISLDLSLIENPKGYQAKAKFKGNHMISEDMGTITFYHMEGDYFQDGVDYLQFNPGGFGYDNEDFIHIWSFTDEEFMGYFLSAMPEIETLIKNHGMSLLVDGGVENLEYHGLGRNISLGTHHDERFVRERHYTVTANGSVFEYDPLDDMWYLSNGM